MKAVDRIKKHVNKQILWGVFQFDTNTLLSGCGADGHPILHKRKRDMVEEWKALSDGECETLVKIKFTVVP